MKRRKRSVKKAPDAPEGVVQLVNFVIGRWKMLATIVVAGGLAISGATWVWNARDVVILKPEANAIHKSLSDAVKIAGVKLDELQRVQIEQLKIDKAVKQRQLRYERDPRIRQDIELDIRDIEKKIDNFEKMRQIK